MYISHRFSPCTKVILTKGIFGLWDSPGRAGKSGNTAECEPYSAQEPRCR